MTASVLPSTPAASCAVRPPTAQIDASTRAAVLWLTIASVKWLLVSLVAGLVSSMKLHMPALAAGIPALTYGRLTALQDSVFIYGFASQAAMAVSIWLICRLGGTLLVGGGVIIVSSIIWNLGVVVGSLGILAGNGSPFEHFQFPHNAMPILFVAYCVFAICAILTFASRKECNTYPSLWFVFAALIFFPWIFISASMTLWSPIVRGSTSPVIAAWAGNGLVTLWLGSVALAAVYYLLPKMTGRSLFSYGLAVFAFWLYVIFGQATGMHFTAAFPAWVSGVSEVCTFMMLLPAFASAYNWYSTVKDKNAKSSAELAFKFASWGAVFYMAASIAAALGALPAIKRLVGFTLFQPGVSQLFLLGFFTLSVFGAVHYMIPRVTGMEWKAPAFHFIGTLAGAGLVSVGLLLGGFAQGSKAANAAAPYVDVARSTVPFVGIIIIGFLLLIVGQLSFLAGLARHCCVCCSKCIGGNR